MTTNPVMTITDELVAELEVELKNPRLTFRCVDCDGVYTDEKVSQCDCMGSENYAEGFVVERPTGLIRALLSERAELKRDAERFREIVCAVVREIPHRNMSRGNAPGHGHSISGVWDEDNGDLAGTECAWCKAWHAASEAAMQERQK